jgi:hypothetical protein
VEDQKRVAVSEGDIQMGVEFLGLGLELALPLRACGACLPASETEGFLPDSRLDAMECVAL